MTEQEDPLAPIIAALKEPVALAPDLTARVMASIEKLPRQPAAWWRRRWTVEVTPLRALAAAAGLAAIMFVSQAAGRRAGFPSAETMATSPGSGPTQFVLVASEAKEVSLVGDFNDWSLSATPLVRDGGNGLWSVTVPLLPGRYRYAYVVDGVIWRPDPDAPAAEDEFGRPNSVLTIGGA